MYSQGGYWLVNGRKSLVPPVFGKAIAEHPSRFDAQGPSHGSATSARLVGPIQLGDVLTLPLAGPEAPAQDSLTGWADFQLRPNVVSEISAAVEGVWSHGQLVFVRPD